MTSTNASPIETLLTERTLELVRIPSPSGGEAAIADHVEAFLRDRAGPTRLERTGNSVVAAWGTGPGEERPFLVLAGHLDTVPEAGQAEPESREGWIHGLGTTDMKGALAVMLTLAEGRRRAASDALPVAMVFYDQEETDFDLNGLGPVMEREAWLSGAGAALMLEPTGNALEAGCLGSLHARVRFEGTAAHSARPWLGRNAVHAAGAFLDGLSRREPRVWGEPPAVYRETISVTRAEAGNGRNVIPARFTLNVNFRFAPDRSPAEAEAVVRELVPAEASLEVIDAAPGARPRLDAPLLDAFRRRFSPEVRAKEAWTDVARFAAAGVPAANFGPGVPELAHRRDERVETAALVRCHEVLEAFLEGGGSAT